MANRKRSKHIHIMMNDEEYELTRSKATTAGMTYTDFIIRLMTEGQIIIVNDLREVIAEIKKQGSNLNQALRYAHESGGLNDEELRIAINDCGEMYTTLNVLAKEISLGLKKRG